MSVWIWEARSGHRFTHSLPVGFFTQALTLRRATMGMFWSWNTS
jgi:hypothetical protein